MRNEVIRRTAKATGIGMTTVKSVKREFMTAGGFSSPVKRYKESRVRVFPDDFDREAIRRAVHDFYLQKSYPTLDKLLCTLREKDVFQGGRTTLSKVLKSMGFKYKVREDGKRYVYEQPKVIQQRHDYLRRMRRNRQEGRPQVYLDDTWINSHAAPERIWVDEDGSGGWKRPSGKGERLIILHAGIALGWVPECGKWFKSKTKSADYHDEMNAQHFLEWFETQLMPNIPPHSLIILDNAKYHNTVVEKVPTKSSRKEDMRQWLTRHGIPFNPNDLKRDLLCLIKASNIRTKYKTDVIAEKIGHEVMRLPVAHCELNPIEMAWATVKNYIRTNNKTFTMKEAQSLVGQGFCEVTPAKWAKMCEHVKKVEDAFWDKDGLIEDAIEEFVIRFGPNDSDDEYNDKPEDDYTGNFSDNDSDLSDDEYDRQLLEQERQKLDEIMHAAY